MSTSLTAIILCAGRGTRLAPLTDNTHKSLIPIGSQTILQRQLNQLAACGIKKITVVTGHRAGEIESFISNYPRHEFEISCVQNNNFDQTNTGYSLGIALANLASPFILLDGDVVMDDGLLQSLLASGPDTLLCETDPAKLDGEAVKTALDAAGKIRAIGKNIPKKEAAGESIGVGYFGTEWARALQSECGALFGNPQKWNHYYEDVMQELFDRKSAPSALSILSTQNFHWVEVDDHDDYRRACHLYSSSSSSE